MQERTQLPWCRQYFGKIDICHCRNKLDLQVYHRYRRTRFERLFVQRPRGLRSDENCWWFPWSIDWHILCEETWLVVKFILSKHKPVRASIPISPQPAHLQISMKFLPKLLLAFIIVVTVFLPPINSCSIGSKWVKSYQIKSCWLGWIVTQNKKITKSLHWYELKLFHQAESK